MSFNTILTKYRNISFSQRDKGDRFERLIQAYLLTEPLFTNGNYENNSIYLNK